MYEVEHILAVQNILGEGPVWHSQENVLYWVDIQQNCYHRYDPATRIHTRHDMPLCIGTLAFRASGGFVLATAQGFATYLPDTQTLQMLTNPEAHKTNTRFNDGAVDREGRFWAGTLGDKFNNALYRLDPDGQVHTMETGIDISNGIGWSPDNKTMYYTDSTPALIYAYDYDAASGAISNRRVLVESRERVGVPDGLTVDQDGFIWSARWGGSCIERYDPTGKLERTIHVPVLCPTSVAFGGADLRDLYITSARAGLPQDQRDLRSSDGDLFRVRLDVGGFPEPFFAG